MTLPRVIGQYDSPFVRRTAIALRRYGMPYEHVPWSVWADAEALVQHNPLRRVPTLILADGSVLIESAAILDYLDEQVGPARALLPAKGSDRRAGLFAIALATGIADKAVSLLYENVLRAEPQRSHVWAERCSAQIGEALRRLEQERAARNTPYWFGEELSHADIAVACVLRFVSEAHPVLAASLAPHAGAAEPRRSL